MKRPRRLLLSSSILSVLVVGSVMATVLSFTSSGVVSSSTTVNPLTLGGSSIHTQVAAVQTIAASASTIVNAAATLAFTSGQVTPSSATLNCVFQSGISSVCFNQVTYSQQVEGPTTTVISGVANTLNQNTAAFDFSLSNSGNIVVFHGNSGSTTITGTLVIGSTQQVALKCSSGLPSGASCSFSGTSYPNFQEILTITTTLATPGGFYPITVTGTAGSLTKTTSFTLTVNPLPQNALITGVGSGQGSVSLNCPSACQETLGTSISLTASPASGWAFSSWATSGASCSGGASSNPCTFTMPNNAVTVQAIFITSPAAVGGYLQPINTAEVLSSMLVQGVSGYWWLLTIAAIAAVAVVILRRHRS